MKSPDSSQARRDAMDIFLAGVDSVKPDNLIHRFVSLSAGTLCIENLSFELDRLKHIYVIGAGKAGALMAQSVEAVLGGRITAGHIVTKYGHACPLRHLAITEAGHPVPDENGLLGTAEILALAQKAAAADLVLCLISGGGSALLADVPAGCSLADLRALNDILLKCGADIVEINCIRKHLSRVKGGRLARVAQPARLVSLILSDVIGDPLDAIASGPTAPDPTTYGQALAVLDRHGIRDEIPPGLLRVLEQGAIGNLPETPKPGDGLFNHTHNLVIGSNRLALESARVRAESLGYRAHVLTSTLAGDTNAAACQIVELALKTRSEHGAEKTCLLLGGEPTMKVTGNGLGGRNQHLALLAARLLADHPGLTVLSGGTDGSDGPTDAAGAVSDSQTTVRARALNLDLDRYLENCDSYNFFDQVGGLVRTGPTQTNVMDLIVVLIEPIGGVPLLGSKKEA